MKTVLITGAASGIGKETALYFAKKKWNVIATMRDLSKTSVFENIPNISCCKMDVTDERSITACLKHVLDTSKSIDCIVNNAGLFTTGPLELYSNSDIKSIVDTNIIGTINVTRLAIPILRQQKRGVIVNLSSVAGRVTFPFQSVYHTTKWAIEGFSQSLVYELKKTGIRVKVVEPGMVKTDLYNNVKNQTFHDIPQEYSTNYTNWYDFLMSNYEKGYSPIRDAKTIYNAAISRSSKLRFRTDNSTRLLVFLHAIMSLKIFTRFISILTKQK